MLFRCQSNDSDTDTEVANMSMTTVVIESSNEAKSHFQPYCKGLRLSKLLGLPLKIDLTHEKEVKFEDRLRFVKCGLEIGKNSTGIWKNTKDIKVA